MMRSQLHAFASVFVLAIVRFTSVAVAHGGQEHVMGTVKAVDEGSITVTTTARKDVTVQLDPSTKFHKGNSAATAKDVIVGDRVVIHAKRGASGLTATVVKVAAGRAGEHR